MATSVPYSRYGQETQPPRSGQDRGATSRVGETPDRLRQLTDASGAAVAQAVNSALVLLDWQVGDRIQADVLPDNRATYGEYILRTLSAKLAPSMARGSANETWHG